MELQCDRCGTEFDTDREHAAGPHADTARCPSCGEKHEVPATDGSGEPAADETHLTVPTGDGEIHVHIHIHGG